MRLEDRLLLRLLVVVVVPLMTPRDRGAAGGI
jgi:hypothetical protein